MFINWTTGFGGIAHKCRHVTNVCALLLLLCLIIVFVDAVVRYATAAQTSFAPLASAGHCVFIRTVYNEISKSKYNQIVHCCGHISVFGAHFGGH